MLAQRNTHTHTQNKVESTLCARVVDVRQHRNYTCTPLQTVKQHAHVPFAEHLRAALRHSAEFFTVCVLK